MSKSCKGVSQRVKGVILGRDSAGLPIDLHTDNGPQQIARKRKVTKRRYQDLYCAVSLPEHEALDDNRERAGGQTVIFDEDMNSWDHMETEADSLTWVDEEWDTSDLGDNIIVDLSETHFHRKDYRTCRDRLLQFYEAWQSMYPDMVQAYLEWDCRGPPEPLEHVAVYESIKFYDIFDTSTRSLPMSNSTLTVSLVQHGYIGNAPHRPSVTFSIQLLELFRVMNTRAPGLSLLKYSQGLCELYKIAYPPSLRTQLSSAYDAYLQVLAGVTESINCELERNSPFWNLRNACPACTYVLEDEPSLKFSMLVAMDGNNSLKCVPRSKYEKDNDGKIISSMSIEQPDARLQPSTLYMTDAIVDTFGDEVKKHKPKDNPIQNTNANENNRHEGGGPIDGVEEPTPCTERWTNLANESSKKIWGIFHETGIFTAVCRHGIILVLCDMICSGELAKYPLAIVDRLISELGPNLMIGYDIGCGFSTTASRSPMVGPKVKENHVQFCVGSFHGQAHNRLCQLDWHPLYVEGCGIEDFETCERVFSQSNALAASTRHASAFHRHQAITNFFLRWNRDKYADLSTFIFNNYKQATLLLRDLPSQLQAIQMSLKVPSTDIFRKWLQEEKEYLLKMKKQPPNSNLQVDYLKSLVKLQEAEKKHQLVRQQWLDTPIDKSQPSYTVELLSGTHRQALDNVLLLQNVVADLEMKLEIATSWTPQSPEWKEVEELILQEEYREALDKLEGLVVSRLFELTKMNQSGIGVKLRSHISKALKNRSASIRNAVKEYNAAAVKLQPPRQTLDIKTVLEYVFVAEFDLLRDSRLDIQHFAWTRAAEREASITYWKIERAREEVQHLNVEARRLLTYLKDEEAILEELCIHLQTTNPLLCYQVGKQLLYLVHINRVHFRRLKSLFSHEDYSGLKTTGTCKASIHAMSTANDGQGRYGNEVLNQDEDEDGFLESDDEERDEILNAAIHCLSISE